MKRAIDWMERGLIPDFLIRAGIRRLTKNRLNQVVNKTDLVEKLRQSPIAVHTKEANDQHYEAPPEFFSFVLGPQMKYSCCFWPEGVQTLWEAEEASLKQVGERAQLDSGQEILELGCGWGALTLWMARNYPSSQITAVSNSAFQREFILERAKEQGLKNVEALTADMNHFDTDKRFDRIVSLEMFEHMRNYQKLLRRISGWLKNDGELFVHIFTHRHLAYLFEDKSDSDWMSRNFFTGGIMPSEDLLSFFQDDLKLIEQWKLPGDHYQKTAVAWLENMDQNQEKLLPILEEHYGIKESRRWFQRWRVFFMACAELWGYKGGEEWGVSHYLFRK